MILACSQKTELTTTASNEQNWTHYVRTAGHGLAKSNIEQTISDAQETYLFGIEVDNDPPGRYDSFLDPTEKLEALEILARRAHEINNYAFLYIAGLECITADANQKEHTFFKDHPDWVQRDIDDRPAMFGGGDAFWISEGDEDVWITPYAEEWRRIYMEHVRKIAKTGIDGIYVDIPYWMTHFDGWEDTWASFDQYTLAAFKKRTGLDAKKDLKLGDFQDANFRRWIDFRIETLTEFMAEIDRTAKSVNPQCMVIAEIYPGLGEESIRVGADVYDMYPAVDVIAHEYSGGRGNAASKDPLDWFTRMAGMYTFRAFAEGKASWMLSYSWDEKNKVPASEAIKNLALSNVIAGTNCWDARGHVMSGSNDIETRKEVYKWIAENEKIFYSPREPIQPIGIYFSPKTRNYFADTFMRSYQGMMYLMLQGHLEFEVVTPRTLKDFKGEILVLADVKCISEAEMTLLTAHIQAGKALIITGESGKYDETGKQSDVNQIQKMLELTDGSKDTPSFRQQKFIYYPVCPGKKYTEYCRRAYNHYAWTGKIEESPFITTKDEFFSDLNTKFSYQPAIRIKASHFISTQIVQIDSKPHVFLANFKGLKRDSVATQIPESDIEIGFPAKPDAKIYFLPFLGEKIQLDYRKENEQLVCVLPDLQKGGVVWIQ
jgi:hypothetical protein